MLSKRIIPCMDLEGCRVSKGICFEKLIRLPLSPRRMAKEYCLGGADEIVILNISKYPIRYYARVVKDVARVIDIPLCVGGNINSVSDACSLFMAGADKICLNSSLFKKNIVEELCKRYGSQSIVASIDTKLVDGIWIVYINGGSLNTGVKLNDWMDICYQRGVGEMLITNIMNDGTMGGYNLALSKYISHAIRVPYIISGGAGCMENIYDALCYADGALIASALHQREYKISMLKNYLAGRRLRIRW
ncbi:imidazole glycerol phosphate synthase subunit HisF [Candidatus Vidania fulgoroideorum]